MADIGRYSENLPDGYRLGTLEQNCGNCGAFNESYCEMYYVPVEANATCDDWTRTFQGKRARTSGDEV